MGAATSKVTYLDKAPVDIALLYKALAGGSTLTQVAEDEYHGKCLIPEHADSSPSCHYNLKKNNWHCKVCDTGGGAAELVMMAQGLKDRAQAMKWLKDNKFIQDRSPAANWEKVDVTYDYVDEEGALLYQVGRWNNPKSFGQRMPDGKGGWKYTLKDLERRVPYMLPELNKAIRRGETIYVVEGEKDVNNLYALGFAVTTSAQGAGWKWPVEWSNFFVGAKRVIVISDNDDPGREAARQRASLIARVCQDVRVIAAMPGVAEKGDVSDWLQLEGSGYEALERLTEEAEQVEAYVPVYPVEAVQPLIEDLSDTGNGQWFKACVGEDYRYILDKKDWLTWTGKVWSSKVNKDMVTENVVNQMLQAQRDYDGPVADEFEEHVKKRARSMNARKSMLQSAQGPLGMSSEDFDQKPTLLNCDNGTMDLVTGDLLEHRREDYITKMSPVAYDQKADCPNFKQWLMAACNGSQALFDYMQEVMGSCLEGRAGLRRFYFIFGPKGTGKSTFTRTLERLLGPYQCSIDFKALAESRFSDGNGPTPALARLRGMRMVSAQESRDSDKLDVARIKQLIGGDSITARHLNQGMEEFKFEATLIMSGNEMPRIVGDESVWDKFKPVPFIHQIDGEDPNYESKYLYPELPGILRFALEGLMRLRAKDYQSQDPPEVIEARSQEMDAQDPFADFASEVLNFQRNAEIECDKAFEAYTAWCAKNKQYVFKRQKLTRWLKEKHGVTVRQANVKKYYVGLCLRYNPTEGGGGGGGKEEPF